MLNLSLVLALLAQAVAAEPPIKPEAQTWPGPLGAFGSYGPTDYGSPKPTDPPLSTTLALEHDPFALQVRLSPVNVAELLEQDRLSVQSGQPLRAGIGRAIEAPAQVGQWNALPGGGGLWTISMVAEGAVGVRLRLSSFSLPDGAAVRVWSPLHPEDVDGPFTATGPFDSGEFWSTVILGQEAYLEYFDPAAAPQPPASLPFVVEQVQHLYRDPLVDSGPPLGQECHNDVTCRPEWADLSLAVARFTYVDNGMSYLCSGQLVDTVVADQTPYFLTASHCARNASVASTMVFYWKYQTSECDGIPPDPQSVPTSSAAQFLAGDSQNDVSLVMALGELPPGLFWAGWNTNGVADETECVCIHHPLGEHKRISMGTKRDEQDNYLKIDWDDGVTEPGSSGGGAFLSSTGQLVGVLSGGPSSCGGPAKYQHDFFGAFERVCPLMCPWLQRGSDDAWEPNSACLGAPLVPPGAFVGLIAKSTDEDWYRVRSASCGELGVTLRFNDAYGDIDMELYDACSGGVVASSEGDGDAESLTYAAGVSAEYWLRVFLRAGTRNTYAMTVTLDGVNQAYTVPTPVAIPDDNTAGVQQSFFVPDHFVIEDLDVGVLITHTWNGDLNVTLSHGATTALLIDRPGLPPPTVGFNNNGFDVILDDSAVTPIEQYDSGGPTVVGTFAPNKPLAVFNGQDVYGNWTLTVSDRFAQDTGMLQQWALYVTEQPPPEPCECGGSGDATGDGNTDLADMAAFQSCFTGAGQGPITAGCEALEFNCDADVDLEDWKHMVGQVTGPRPGGIGTPDPPADDGNPTSGTGPPTSGAP